MAIEIPKNKLEAARGLSSRINKRFNELEGNESIEKILEKLKATKNWFYQYASSLLEKEIEEDFETFYKDFYSSLLSFDVYPEKRREYWQEIKKKKENIGDKLRKIISGEEDKKKRGNEKIEIKTNNGIISIGNNNENNQKIINKTNFIRKWYKEITSGVIVIIISTIILSFLGF